jgi:hypothetical protein
MGNRNTSEVVVDVKEREHLTDTGINGRIVLNIF